MSEQKTSTREKIVLAAIDCIEKKGIERITIRGIASEAGVNSAAINYYFRSKEKLIRLALNRTLNELTKMPAETLEQTDLPPREKLKVFLETFMGGAVKWPGIAKAHLYAPLMEGNYKTPFVKNFNSLLNDLTVKIKDLKLKQKGKDLNFIVLQILSAVSLPGLLPGLFKGFARLDFMNEKTRKAYIADLIDCYFE
jgi:AcrR family transcriptional regulator